MYRIKPLKKENIPFVCNLMSEEKNVIALHTDIISLEEWQKVFTDSESDIDEENFIIFNNDTPCGWFKLNGLLNSDTAWVSMLVVSDKYKRQGAGKFTVEFIAQYLKNRGYKHIKLQTTKDNFSAINLYEKCGFRQIEKGKDKLVFSKED